jgi:flagellar biosynthesis protein FlhB
MTDDSTSEKEFAPTQRKLDEARRKGEVPIGRDLLAAAGLGGMILALVLAPDALIGAATTLRVLLDQADSLASLLATGDPAPAGGLAARLGAGLAPVMLLPGLLVLGVLIAQRGLVFSGERLKPKLSRISPLAGAKRRFGRSGLFDFAKSAVKLGLISGVLGLFLAAESERILSGLMLGPGQVSLLLGWLIVEFLCLVVGVQLVIGAIDLWWQHAEHHRRQRMSRKEMTDEMKQSEGDPQIKAQRRQKALDIANNRMLADVAKADVIIVNPTHYAVALRWDRRSGSAPVCVAKGVDEIAATIRRRASEAGVPIHSDPPTARALHASVAVGEEIHPEHYRPVAAAIRFAERLRARARAQGIRR